MPSPGELVKESAREWDAGLVAAGLALVAASGVAMASAGASVSAGLAVRHGVWIAMGLLLFLGVASTNYRRWIDGAAAAYGLSLVLLAIVLAAGVVRLGATRWLSLYGLSVQPSEFAKLATTLMLARYLAGQASPLPGRVVVTSLAIVAPAALLVFIQPDLGSASIFLAIWLGMAWVAGMSRRTLAGLGGLLAVLAPLAWQCLKGYQRDRLLAFINPHADPLGAGYTIIQSTIAIGSGRLWGRGWFAGTQNQLSFLPEHHSDFIFSVIGEEWGFLGCLGVIVAFAWLFSRILRVALAASAPQGRLLAAGVCSWVAYQAFVNMGMVMGLLPVVGVPLPFISYGGSSMIMLWVALGLVQSVSRTDALR
jgi:rod shape determining protein RodA